MSSSLQYALVGCGNIGQRHALQMARTGKLIAVCDTDPAKAESLAKTYAATPYYTIQDLLNHEKPNLVAVCTPNGLHALHTIEALKHGAHVLCEKPLAISVTDGMEMIKTASECQKKLFVVKQNRFNPPVLAVKKLLDQRQLGNILSFQINCFWNRPAAYYQNSWKGSKDLDGGTLFTQFSHFIDILYWWLGNVQTVTATTANLQHQQQIEFEDTGIVLLEMESGALGTLQYTVNSYAKNMEGSVTLFGEKGTIKIGGQYLNELSYQSIQDVVLPELPQFTPANNYGNYTGSMSNHHKVYDQLVRDVLEGENELPSANDGLETVRIIEKIYQAAKC